jgi:hypothetical protein
MMLQCSEATVAQARAPETSRRPQEVEVKPVIGPAPPREDEAGLQQGEIEARPVVRDDPVEVPKQRVERGEQRGLLVQIAHEVLAHLKAIPVEESDTDEEGIGSRPAREPRRLRVEKEQARSIVEDGVTSRQEAERHRRDLARAPERVLAVAMLEMEPAPDEQHPPGVVFLDGTAQRIFDGRRAARRRAETVLRLDPSDDSPEVGCGQVGRRSVTG